MNVIHDLNVKEKKMGTTKLLNLRQVSEKTSLGGTTINRLTLTKKFPRPIKLADRYRVAWVEAEVDQWIADQIAASRIAEAA